MSVSTRDAQDAPCCLRRWERLGAGEVAVVRSVPGGVPWESRPGGGVLGDPPEEPPGTLLVSLGGRMRPCSPMERR